LATSGSCVGATRAPRAAVEGPRQMGITKPVVPRGNQTRNRHRRAHQGPRQPDKIIKVNRTRLKNLQMQPVRLQNSKNVQDNVHLRKIVVDH
jgi:hypothetical protein